MNIRTLAARGLSFAHLSGRSTLAARAEGDEPDDEDKEKKDARRAEGDEPEEKDEDDKQDKGSKKGKRADGGDDDESAEEDDDKDDKPKGKKAKAEKDEPSDEDDEHADDEDDDEEMRGKSAVARGRRREQARCAAIFASKAAAHNPVLAANLAFKTRMTRSEAIAMLEGTPAPASSAHASRAARNPDIGIGGGAKPSPQQALAARWDQNLKAANPGRR